MFERLALKKGLFWFMLKVSFILFSNRKISRLYSCFILSKEVKTKLLPSFSCLNNIMHCVFFCKLQNMKAKCQCFLTDLITIYKKDMRSD